MAAQNFTEFNLPQNAYAAFDAVSLKSLIINRLTASNAFTDQVYEGSNLSSIIDIIAYSYHVSLFYLNNQSAEASFNQAALYENMNKIVTLIGYNPMGSQTAITPFTATAQANLVPGNYIIPRYSFVAVNGVFYSLTQDVYFEKTSTDIELLESIGDQNLLYQGQFKEYPTQSALGIEFETLTIAVDSIVASTDSFIDSSNIFVYIQDTSTQSWSQWKEVETLFNQGPIDRSFEKRLNENGRYELKFGNSINGRKLNAGDSIAIYYLQSNGGAGVISALSISNAPLVIYTTPRTRVIFPDVLDAGTISQNDLNSVYLTNTSRSTDPKSLETVDEIRTNAPKAFASQNRAVTVQDFNTFMQRNFSNVIRDVQTISNSDYIDGYIKYFYDIGLHQPNDDSRVLLNQVTFADACDFNNVYIFTVPRNFLTNEVQPQYLSVSLKQLIVNKLQNTKMQSVEVVPSDPIYTAIDVALSLPGEILSTDIISTSFIAVKRRTDSKISASQIKTNVYNAFLTYFSVDVMKLGQTIDLLALTSSILSIAGVESVSTIRKDGSQVFTIPGISLMMWNPQYSMEDIIVTTQNTTLPLFKYPYLNSKTNLANRIVIV